MRRRRALNNENVPRCPVCKARYGGSDQRPGLRVLARHMSAGLVRQFSFLGREAVRFCLLGLLLVRYGVAGDNHGSHDKDGAGAAAGSFPSSPIGMLRSILAAAAAGLASAGLPDFPLQGDSIGEGAEGSEGGHRECGEGPGELFFGSGAGPGSGPGTAFASFLQAFTALALMVFLTHHVLVLTVSMPPLRRDPPHSRFLRWFFTEDVWEIARFVAELAVSALLLGVRTANGLLPLRCFMPVLIAVAIPMIQVLTWYPIVVCFEELVLFIAFCFCAPLLALLETGKLLARYRRRVLNPLDGPMHVGLTFLATMLCLAFKREERLVRFFAPYSVFLLLGLLERLTWRRVPWKDGRAWWNAVLIGLEAFSLAVRSRWLTLLLLLLALRSLQRAAARPRPPPLFEGSMWWCTLLVFCEAVHLLLCEVLKVPENPAPLIVKEAIVAWLALLAILALSVNWKRCVRQYRTWQRRNATFVLCATPDVDLASPRGRGSSGASSHTRPLSDQDLEA